MGTFRQRLPSCLVACVCVSQILRHSRDRAPLLGQHLSWAWAQETDLDGLGPIPVQHSPSRWVVDIYHPHLVTRQVTVLCSQSLCQAICKLLPRADMSKADDPSIKFLLNEEAINFHMFCPIMLNWVISNGYS